MKKREFEKTKPICEWANGLKYLYIKWLWIISCFEDGEKTKPIQACPERSRMEPTAGLWPDVGGRTTMDDGGAWMMDGSTLVNRFSFFLDSDQRPSAAVGKEKLFAVPVQ